MRNFKKKKELIRKMEDELDELTDRIEELEASMIEQQQRSRRNNLEIHGLPVDILDENLEKTCMEILNNITDDDNKLDSYEIDACHKLPSKNRNTKPIIMRFMNRKRRDELVYNASFLKDVDLTKYGIEDSTKIYINNNLSPQMKILQYHCRCLRREGSIINPCGRNWTTNLLQTYSSG